MTAPHPRRPSRLAVAMITALLATACAKGLTPAPDAGRDTTLDVSNGSVGGFPVAADTCELLREEEVSAIAGFPLSDRSGLARQEASPGPSTRTLCVFADKDGDSVIITVSAETSDGRREYDDAVQGMTSPQPLSGLGDAASWYGRGVVLHLEVLVGDRALSFTVSLAGPDQDQLLGIAKSLAAEVIDRL